MEEKTTYKAGRNDPCPCQSGKKFKRCHGYEESARAVAEAPTQSSAPTGMSAGGGFGGMMGGMGDLAGMADGMGGMDPAWLMQFTTALQRLPKGQLQRFQGLMQKAMSGKDVTRELQEFQAQLPVSMQNLLAQAPVPKEGEAAPGNTADAGESTEKKSGLSRLWKKWKKS